MGNRQQRHRAEYGQDAEDIRKRDRRRARSGFHLRHRVRAPEQPIDGATEDSVDNFKRAQEHRKKGTVPPRRNPAPLPPRRSWNRIFRAPERSAIQDDVAPD